MGEKAGRQTGGSSFRRRWPVILFAALAAVSLLLHAAKLRRQGEVQGLCDQEAMIAVARSVEKTKAYRARFYQARLCLAYPTTASYDATDLVRRFERAARPMRLVSVQVDPSLRGLGFEVTVAVDAKGARGARRKFAAFFVRVQSWPEIAQTSFDHRGRNAAGQHLFTLSGQADLQ
jgi:hypothetical protein